MQYVACWCRKVILLKSRHHPLSPTKITGYKMVYPTTFIPSSTDIPCWYKMVGGSFKDCLSTKIRVNPLSKHRSHQSNVIFVTSSDVDTGQQNINAQLACVCLSHLTAIHWTKAWETYNSSTWKSWKEINVLRTSQIVKPFLSVVVFHFVSRILEWNKNFEHFKMKYSKEGRSSFLRDFASDLDILDYMGNRF